MLVTELDIVTDVRAVEYSNAPKPILVTSNEFPVFVTVAGIVAAPTKL